MSDIPNTVGLSFVDPDESDASFRVVLWAAPGEGKSVAAASAPTPILVVSGDRPGAYRYARRHYGHTRDDLREVRYVNSNTLGDVYSYLKDNPGIRTLVIDPFSIIYDRLVEEMLGSEPEPSGYQRVNKKMLGFLYALRVFDVHVVLVAHERLNDGKGGDGKMYPQLGGPALINKVLAEADIVAHIEREAGSSGEAARFVGQLTPRAHLVCKESTGLLGDRREADLSEWFATATPEVKPAGDLPFDPAPTEDPLSAEEEAQVRTELGVAS